MPVRAPKSRLSVRRLPPFLVDGTFDAPAPFHTRVLCRQPIGTMDGVKLAHHIRERWPPIHLIVASGRAVLEENQLPSNSRFFSKPYDDNAIAREITRVLVALDQNGSGKNG